MKRFLSIVLMIGILFSADVFAEADISNDSGQIKKLAYTIEPKYYSANEFNKHGIAKVQLEPGEEFGERVWGVINLKGERVFGFDGTKFAIRKNGLIMALGDNDKAAFFSSDGKQLTDYVYETFKRVQPKTPHFVTYHYLTDMHDGDGESDLVPICRNGKFGFINSKGEEEIAPTFDYVFGFCEGISKIGYDGVLSEYGTYTQCKFGYINEKGDVLPTGELWAASDFSNGYAKIADGQHKVIDKNGNEVHFATGSFEFLETNGNFILAGYDGGHVVLDMNGKLLSEWAPNIQLFGKSFIIWQKQIADINGNIIYTAPEGTRIYPLHSNYVVRVSAGIAFIDGAASFEGDILVNQNGEVILQAKKIKEVAEGVFYTPEGQALYDVNGTCIATFDGCDVYTSNQLSNMLLPVQSAGTDKWGYVQLPKVANPYISAYTENENYRVEKLLDTEYGTIIYGYPTGTPHGKSPMIHLVRSSGEEINLSEPVSRENLFCWPEHKNITLSEDGKYLTFEASFTERSAGEIGGRLIVLHDAGTYYYKADLEAGKTIETRFEPLDTMGEDVISSWAKPEVERAIELGFVPISIRDNYKRNITRSEFAKMAAYFLSVQYGYQPEHILRTYYNSDKNFSMRHFLAAYCDAKTDRSGEKFKHPNSGEAWRYENKRGIDPVYVVEKTPFTDLDENNIYDNQMIGLAYNFGIINGISETEFNPNGNITRQEAAAMLMRVYKNYAEYKSGESKFSFKDDESIAQWAKEDVYGVNKLGIMQGVGNDSFAPLDGYTVEQSVATFVRLFDSAPVSRKNGNIKPLVDYETEKEIYYAEVEGTIIFTPEKELSFDKYDVVYGTWHRYHRKNDNKVYVFYKNGGVRDLTSFVPVSQDNTEPITEIVADENENRISFVCDVSESFALFNRLGGESKVYSAGKYKFEYDLISGNLLKIEAVI